MSIKSELKNTDFDLLFFQYITILGIAYLTIKDEITLAQKSSDYTVVELV